MNNVFTYEKREELKHFHKDTEKQNKLKTITQLLLRTEIVFY